MNNKVASNDMCSGAKAILIMIFGYFLPGYKLNHAVKPEKSHLVCIFTQETHLLKDPFLQTTILQGSSETHHMTTVTRTATCAYCDSPDHHISKCQSFTQLSTEQMKNWIKEQSLLALRSSTPLQIDLKRSKSCSTCNGRHLQIPCALNQIQNSSEPAVRTLYIDRQSD